MSRAAGTQKKVRDFLVAQGTSNLDVEDIKVLAHEANMNPHDFRSGLLDLSKGRGTMEGERFEIKHRQSGGGRRYISGIRIITAHPKHDVESSETASKAPQSTEQQWSGEVGGESFSGTMGEFLDTMTKTTPNTPTTNIPLTVEYLQKKSAVEDVKAFALDRGLNDNEIIIDFNPDPSLEEAISLLSLCEKAHTEIARLSGELQQANKKLGALGINPGRKKSNGVSSGVSK